MSGARGVVAVPWFADVWAGWRAAGIDRRLGEGTRWLVQLFTTLTPHVR